MTSTTSTDPYVLYDIATTVSLAAPVIAFVLGIAMGWCLFRRPR